MQSFSQLLAKLADAGLDFVIVGGYAAVSHGSAYVTKDVDICMVLRPGTWPDSARHWPDSTLFTA